MLTCNLDVDILITCGKTLLRHDEMLLLAAHLSTAPIIKEVGYLQVLVTSRLNTEGFRCNTRLMLRS